MIAGTPNVQQPSLPEELRQEWVQDLTQRVLSGELSIEYIHPLDSSIIERSINLTEGSRDAA